MRTYHQRFGSGPALLLILVLTLMMTAAVARAETESVSVTLDGQQLQLDVPGEIRAGRTMVPFRAIFEALGAQVSWNAKTQTISATRGDDSLVLTIGSQVVEWRGSLIKVDAPPIIVNGRTLVPLRLVAQAMGLHIRWDQATWTVHLERSPADKALARGIQLVHAKGCMVCHAIKGAGGQLAPKLDGVAEKYGEDWLRTWLRNPQAVREGSRMPNFRFSDEEITAVITYLQTLD